jgi:hypothetical protein
MKEIQRTLLYVAVAAASIGLAVGMTWWTAPRTLEGYEQVGAAFYPDFTDPNEAKSLRVVAYSEDVASARIFDVEYKDGYWRIPSRHNYPADAEDQLAKTASSVIGIDRGALMSRRNADHEQYGVVDPLDDSAASLEGRGQRITLSKADGTVLADFIIGKAVDDQPNHFYVRRPDEKETYRTRLEIKLSTKFADWIEPDLLKLDRDKLVQVVVNKYSIDESQSGITDVSDRELIELTREKPADPWKLTGLDEATEELQTDAISEMVNNLDDLKIVGVRPKPKGLNADLTVDPQIVRNQLVLDLLLRDLRSKGFPIIRGQDGNPHLGSNKGELIACTNEGVVYTLHFGEIFTGTEFEIEAGFVKDDDEAEGKSGAAAAEPADPEADGETEKGVKRSRYLFVTAEFDPAFIGPAPVEPVKPEQPEAGDAGQEASDAAAAKAAQDGDQPASAPAADAPAARQDSDDAKAEKSEGEQSDEDKPSETDAQADYEAALQAYERELGEYRTKLQQYESKLKKGEETVKQLNDRFGEWYYVISADSFETLRLSRQSLIKPKEPAQDDESAADADQPAAPEQDSASPAPQPPSPADAAPSEPQPEASTSDDQPKPQTETKKPDTDPEPGVEKASDEGDATPPAGDQDQDSTGSQEPAGADSSEPADVPADTAPDAR